jgi:hypothetical protein
MRQAYFTVLLYVVITKYFLTTKIDNVRTKELRVTLGLE